MATEERINEARYIELTRKEAANIIGLLGAQLANEPLINNQLGACPDVKIIDKNTGAIIWLSFIVDLKPRSAATETVHNWQTVICLSLQETVNVIMLLAALLADKFPANFSHGSCPNVLVQDKGHVLYRLVLTVSRNCDR